MFKMEVDKILSQTQYALPVGGVLILAILVFVFGFKTVAEPTFSTSLVDEKKKKQQVKQKPKTKKGPVANGAAVQEAVKEVKKAVAISQPKSPAKTAVTKKDSPKKTIKAEVTTKSEKKNAEAQAKVVIETKPDDFDEGDWVQAVSKKKKKTADATPTDASPATSPTHQADKKAEKKKKKEAKKQEEQAATVVEAAPQEPIETSQVEPPKVEVEVTPVVVEEVVKPEEVPAKPVEESKEKNNNSQNTKGKKTEKPAVSKVVEQVEAAPEPAVENEADDQWQENKTKKKKKARRE